jgi:ABC-type cobalamin transport system permease subunit
MGDDEARSLGMRTEGLKAGIMVCTTLITAASVSVCGIVGWVGLVIPHLGRMLVGPDHRALLPMSFCIGATYLCRRSAHHSRPQWMRKEHLASLSADLHLDIGFQGER